jgi:hypothetical protein
LPKLPKSLTPNEISQLWMPVMGYRAQQCRSLQGCEGR